SVDEARRSSSFATRRVSRRTTVDANPAAPRIAATSASPTARYVGAISGASTGKLGIVWLGTPRGGHRCPWPKGASSQRDAPETDRTGPPGTAPAQVSSAASTERSDGSRQPVRQLSGERGKGQRTVTQDRVMEGAQVECRPIPG